MFCKSCKKVEQRYLLSRNGGLCVVCVVKRGRTD